MANWRELAADGKYDEAEGGMLAATDLGEEMFPVNEVRAGFYETWGDALVEPGEKAAKYKAAKFNWEQWASCSTSGGEVQRG